MQRQIADDAAQGDMRDKNRDAILARLEGKLAAFPADEPFLK